MKLTRHNFLLLLIISISFQTVYGSGSYNAGKNNRTAKVASFDLIKRIKGKTKLNEKDYRGALAIYKDLSDKNPENAKLNYRTGECYLNLKMKKEAITYLEKAFKLDNKVCKDIHLQLGKAYHLNNELDKALSEYETFKKASGEGVQKSTDINFLISQVNFAKEQIKNPKNITITNIGNGVNSQYPDYAPSLNADESVLIFTSRRDNTTGGGKDPSDFQFMEDIYISTLDKSTNTWKAPQQISPLINTEGHDASLNISPNGQSIFIYKNDIFGKNGGDIYESKLGADNNWLIPKPLPATINSSYFESSASVTEDGNTLYFASERMKGYGNGDIYRSTKNANGEWGEAENLGNEINTEYDEISSFISADGKTLYFSSKGHLGMGGYDIYKSVLTDGKWSKPENLGYPINSTEDDLHFVKTKNGNHGYFSSIRENKSDRDLYLINFNETVQPVVAAAVDTVKSAPAEKVQVTNTKGQITDQKGKGIAAQLTFSDPSSNEKLVSVETDNQGYYNIPLGLGKKYNLTVNSNGYDELKETYEVPSDSTAKNSKVFKLKKSAPVASVKPSAEPTKPASVPAVSSSTVYFGFNSSALKLDPSIKDGLQGILKQLEENKNATIILNGYSDNAGKEKTNKRLSKARAQNVASYFQKHGISAKRIKVVGNGSANPVASNDTKEGRKQNRRVEISIQ